MRTTITLDDDLSMLLLQHTQAPTMAAAITYAVRDYVRRQELKGIVALQGKIKFEDGYDYKAERRMDRS